MSACLRVREGHDIKIHDNHCTNFFFSCLVSSGQTVKLRGMYAFSHREHSCHTVSHLEFYLATWIGLGTLETPQNSVLPFLDE